MLQIKERDQCIIHEEGILHNIRSEKKELLFEKKSSLNQLLNEKDM